MATLFAGAGRTYRGPVPGFILIQAGAGREQALAMRRLSLSVGVRVADAEIRRAARAHSALLSGRSVKEMPW